MSSLNSYQEECVNTDGNLLITACPGSGKTTVLSKRAARLLSDFPNENLLAVTFTKSAADELRHRVLLQAPTSKNRLATGTFHSLALHQLRSSGLLNQFKILDENMCDAMIESCMEDVGIDGDKNWKLHDVKAYFNRIQSASSPNDHPILDPSSESFNFLIASMWEAYKRFKSQAGGVDFGDMLHIVVDLMREGKIAPYNAKFILGDEAQDMDDLQHAWISLHAQNGSLVTLVGDDDQSIYGFRFSSGYEGMMRFKKSLNSKQVVLPVNYRCGKDILSYARVLIENNNKRVAKPIQAGLPFSGVVFPALLSVASSPYPTIEEQERGYRTSRPTEISNGASFLLEYIKNHKNEHSSLQRDGQRGDLNDWTVLVRSAFIAKEVALCLKADFGLDVVTKKPSLWDSPGGVMFLGFMQYIVNRDWSYMPALLKYFLPSSLLFGEDSAMNLESLIENMVKKDIYVDYLVGLREREQYFLDLIDCIVDQESLEMLTELVKDELLDLIDNVPNKKMTGKRAESLSDTIYVCQSAFNSIGEKKGVISPKEKLRVIQGVKFSNNSDEDSNSENLTKPRFRIMTMHTSKGLEFDNVWIVGADDEGFKIGSSTKDEIIEEERRLFYVAMTRARFRLLLTGITPSQLSNETFLSDMGLPTINWFSKDSQVYSEVMSFLDNDDENHLEW